MRTLTHAPFALSLSKGFLSSLKGESGGLRQAQPERFWVGLGGAVTLAACQNQAPPNNQTAATPPPVSPANPVAIAERLVRDRVAARGAPRFVEGAIRRHREVIVVCGAYEQAGVRQRYIVVNGEDVFVEPEMAAGEMPRAINEFCAEGGRA